ncbi:MAG: HAMP domain-containing histidine kinase [Lachnospiraceae bacterium]|nr:HAMP domain-containing histidine kinase [Lachnospiraceae bacterium]
MKIRRDHGKPIKYSLSWQIAFVTVCLILFTIALCLFVNGVFLGEYYIKNKVKSIEDAYSVLDEAARLKQYNSNEFAVHFEQLCSESNLDIQIMGADGSIVCSSSPNREAAREQFLSVIFGGGEKNHRQQVSADENYSIYRDMDMRTKSEYLLLWGTLYDGNLVLIRTALASIRESAVLSNRFMTYIGIFVCVVTIVISTLLAQRTAKPIVQLTDISKRMAELDFTAKYPEDKMNVTEVGELGHYMNVMSESLEKTISELKTANNELMRDNEKKTRIDEMRKEFLSNVSHELKTPLALVQGYAEGLKECVNDDPESINFYCDVIMDETERMSRMVQKLLTLNRLEFDTKAVELERFNLTELVKGVSSTMMVMMGQKGIELIFDEPDYFVWADEFEVEEVVTNYLSNAINHCDGAKKIHVSMEDREKTVRLLVENTGDNIPEEELEKIWIKFYKVDKARTREYGGSGIGLSIVKAIMESLNRDYGVYNTPEGVCFYAEFEK